MLPHTTAEWTILDLLIEATGQTLTVPELVQAIGSPATTAEALDALYDAGLIARVGQTVRIAPGPPGRDG